MECSSFFFYGNCIYSFEEMNCFVCLLCFFPFFFLIGALKSEYIAFPLPEKIASPNTRVKKNSN